MLSETLSEGLEQYAIGPKIRSFRKNKKLSLVQLGDHTGLSTAMLSKIERGQIFPTLPTLLRIAMVFGVGLDHFFADDKATPVVSIVRAKDRLRLPDRPGDETPSFYFESLDFPVSDRKLESYRAEFPAGGEPSEPHEHDGAELVYVLKGTLVINIYGVDHELSEADAIYFDSAASHTYRCVGKEDAAAIVVVAP